MRREAREVSEEYIKSLAYKITWSLRGNESNAVIRFFRRWGFGKGVKMREKNKCVKEARELRGR